MNTTTPTDDSQEAQAARLALLGSNIEGWRAERSLSYAELRRACDGLTGSDRQFSRVKAGELEGVSLEDWLPRYESAWALLEARTDEAAGEELYSNLTLPLRFGASVLACMKETGLQRCIIVTAPSGFGKSTAARMIRAKLMGRSVEVVADPSWAKPTAMLAGIAAALGLREPPQGEAALLAVCVKLLTAGRKLVIIDEAHHLSARTINFVIALINRTPGEFALLSVPTLWVKLEQANAQECRQLTRNRLHERIAITKMELADVERVVVRRLSVEAAVATQFAKIYCAGGEERNLSLLAAVCREALRLHEGDTGVMSAAVFADALRTVGGRR